MVFDIDMYVKCRNLNDLFELLTCQGLNCKIDWICTIGYLQALTSCVESFAIHGLNCLCVNCDMHGDMYDMILSDWQIIMLRFANWIGIVIYHEKFEELFKVNPQLYFICDLSMLNC